MNDHPPKPKTNIYAVIFWALHVLCVLVVPAVLWLAISALYDAEQRNPQFQASGWAFVLNIFALFAAIGGAAMGASAVLRILDELRKRMDRP